MPTPQIDSLLEARRAVTHIVYDTVAQGYVECEPMLETLWATKEVNAYRVFGGG